MWFSTGIAALWLALIPLAAHAAANPNKVVRLAFEAAEAGFDPVRISDGYSSTVIEAIFDRLLTYDYLARPAKLAPMIAESMPDVADDGRTYTFHLRKGVTSRPTARSKVRAASSSPRISCTCSCGSWIP